MKSGHCESPRQPYSLRIHAAAHQGKEEPHMGNPVVHFEVIGRDAQALQRFYKDAFGWQMEEAIPDFYAMVQPGGEGSINGGIGAAMGDGAGHVTFYVAVPDLEAALSKIEGLGAAR